MLTRERLLELLHYDQNTGIFTWRVNRGGRKAARAGSVAGHTRPDGYFEICVDRNRVLAHRLAWFYVHGRWPAEQIDHMNGIRLDNRLSNLREATQSQNNANRPPVSGLKGVYFHKRAGRWAAQIKQDGEVTYLGLHDTPQQAHAAYCEAAERLFGEFARAA